LSGIRASHVKVIFFLAAFGFGCPASMPIRSRLGEADPRGLGLDGAGQKTLPVWRVRRFLPYTPCQPPSEAAYNPARATRPIPGEPPSGADGWPGSVRGQGVTARADTTPSTLTGRSGGGSYVTFRA
jgi:hypothetical protein